MKILINILYYILAVILFFLYWPFLLSILLPLHTLRIFVSCLSKKFKPSLGRMLSYHSAILALDSMYKKPSCTLMPCLLFDGVLDLERMKKRLEAVVALDDYAELRSTLVKWMGFYFWKIFPDVSLDEHLTIIDAPTKRDALPQIEKDASTKPYLKDKPLWEFIIYTNVIPDDEDKRHGTTARTTIVMLRLHHSMADGYTILNLVDAVGEQPIFTSVPKPAYPKKLRIEHFLFWLRLIFSGPMELLHTVYNQWHFSSWRPRPHKSHYDFNEDWSDEVNFDDLREIAKALKVPTSVIVFSVYTNCVYKIMMEKGEKIPKKLVMSIPIPAPGHPTYPTNHMLMAHFLAPLEIQDPIERLHEMNKRLNKLKNSPVFLHFNWWSAIYGYLSGLSFGLIKPIPLSPVMIINFPGPRDVHLFLGVPMLTFNLRGGIPLGNCNVMLCSHSYGGRLILKVSVDTILYKEIETPKKMLKWAIEEINFLKNEANKEIV